MELAGVVLAAGAGRRLRPITDYMPKAMCPVANTPLVDLALKRVGAHVSDVAVNAHYHSGQLVQHLQGRAAHISVEHPAPLGTAGAIGNLGDWLRGRPVLICNADTWLDDDLTNLLSGWSGTVPRLLVSADLEDRADFSNWRFVGASLLPGPIASGLPPVPSGLYEAVWREAWQRKEIELIDTTRTAVDCGTPARYLRANMLSSGGQSVIAPDAEVGGTVIRSLVMPGGYVAPGEYLVDVIRTREGATIQL